MGKLKSLILLLVAGFAFNACTDQGEIKPDEPEFVSVVIPDAYKTQDNARTSADDVDDVTVDVQITLDNGDIVTGKARLVMHGDESLSYFALTENLMEAADLSPDFWVESNGQSGSRMMGCFSNCKRDFEKGDGLGLCKAECWLQIAIIVIAIV